MTKQEVTVSTVCLYTIAKMLPKEKENEVGLLLGIRNDLRRLRIFLDNHFKYEK